MSNYYILLQGGKYLDKRKEIGKNKKIGRYSNYKKLSRSGNKRK